MVRTEAGGGAGQRSIRGKSPSSQIDGLCRQKIILYCIIVNKECIYLDKFIRKYFTIV